MKKLLIVTGLHTQKSLPDVCQVDCEDYDEARCETCRHWGGNLEGLELPDDTGRRICLRATMSGVVSRHMRVTREGDSGAALWTSESFGCALWESK